MTGFAGYKDGFVLLAYLMAAIVLLLGYLLGCFNGSVMVSHFVIRDDVRSHGSGNAGLTNFYRTYGAKYALGVIALDMGKTVVACLIGVRVSCAAARWPFCWTGGWRWWHGACLRCCGC